MTTQELDKILEPYWEEGWDGYCRFDDGWANLVFECHLNILKIDPNYRIHQIKEKFGGFRFYYQSDLGIWVEQIDTIIVKYVEILRNVCENCGRDGELCEQKYWLKTLCSDCAKELNYKKCVKKL